MSYNLPPEIIDQIGHHLPTSELNRMQATNSHVRDLFARQASRRSAEQLLRANPVRTLINSRPWDPAESLTFLQAMHDVIFTGTPADVIDFFQNELPAEALYGRNDTALNLIIHLVDSLQEYNEEDSQNHAYEPQHIVAYIQAITLSLKVPMVSTTKAVFAKLRKSLEKDLKKASRILGRGNEGLSFLGDLLHQTEVLRKVLIKLQNYLLDKYQDQGISVRAVTNHGEPDMSTQVVDSQDEMDMDE